MRVAAVRVLPYRLPLKRPWVAASATLTERQGALLQVTTADGLSGWGDCAPLPSSGAAGHAKVLDALAQLARRGAGEVGDWEAAGATAPPEVRWAVQTALLDIEAQQRGIPLARLLGAVGDEGLSVGVNAALGPLDARCAARAAEALARGFDVGKIKVGIQSVDHEAAQLHALVEATGGRLRLRLDANRAWPEAEARRFLSAVAALPIEAIEEPLAAPTVAALAALQAQTPIAIAVDESLPHLGAAPLIAAQAVRRFIVKPARIGGYAATLAIAKEAAQAGIALVLTSVVDSAVGVTAAAHLAAAVSPDLVHGLGTSDWLAVDVAAAPPIAAGRLQLPKVAGLGIVPENSDRPVLT